MVWAASLGCTHGRFTYEYRCCLLVAANTIQQPYDGQSCDTETELPPPAPPPPSPFLHMTRTAHVVARDTAILMMALQIPTTSLLAAA